MLPDIGYRLFKKHLKGYFNSKMFPNLLQFLITLDFLLLLGYPNVGYSKPLMPGLRFGTTVLYVFRQGLVFVYEQHFQKSFLRHLTIIIRMLKSHRGFAVIEHETT